MKYQMKLTPIDHFNGSRFVTVGENGIVTGTGQSLARQSAVGGGYLFMQLNAGNQGLLEQGYTALKDSVYGGLVLQTRLKGYLDAISLTVDEGGVEIGAANDRDWTTVA